VVFSSISAAIKYEVFSIIETCTVLRTDEEFKRVFNRINKLLGQEMAAYGIGEIRTMKVISNFNAGFSADFMEAIIDTSGRMHSPLFRLWLRRQAPQVIDFSDEKSLSDLGDLTPYQDFSLQNVMSHGVVDYNQQYMTYFGFAKIPERIDKHHIKLLEILAPYLHVAYSQLTSNKKTLLTSLNVKHEQCGGASKVLSTREHEVLCWLSEGKSNWEIGEILVISENTVKNHMKNILKKLEANNRQHAVAIAFKKGLLKLQF